MSRPNRWVGLEADNAVRSGPHPWVRKFFHAGGFVIRHGIASALTIAIPCLLWIVVYFALLIWAVIWNEPVGGPLGLPFGFFLLGAALLIAVVTILFPAVAIAEWIGRNRGWNVFFQIPLSIALMAVIHGLWSTLSPGIPASERFRWLLLPLGLYWWISQSGPLVLAGWRCLKRRAKI
jgi:hypothetical protein